MPAGKVGSAGGEGTPVLSVTTKSAKKEVGIDTLIGDYAEKGTNHGKKVYKKVQAIPGHEDIGVFLYYWDQRDGADFSGWWFGDQVGGSQVWARCSSHGPHPPRVGWKIPWDAATATPGQLSVDPYTGGSSPASAATSPAASPTIAPATGGMAPQARVKKATDAVAAAEKTAKEALTAAGKILGGTATEAQLKEQQSKLQVQQAALNAQQSSLTKDIAEARKGGMPATASVTELSNLSPRIRTVLTQLNAEIAKVKTKLTTVQREALQAKSAEQQKQAAEEQKQAEDRDNKDLQVQLPAARADVGNAEDAVEQVSAMAQPLIADPPDEVGDTLGKALGEIETVANDAQKKINEARQNITNKLQGARKYAPETRKAALAEYSAMQSKLTESQKKLNPYKNFRKEFHARVEARKQLTEITDKVSAAELEVEKAAMMSSGAGQGQMTEEELKATQETVAPAQQIISTLKKTMETKTKTANTAMKEELAAMTERLGQAEKKLGEVTAQLAKQKEGITVQKVLSDAAEKVKKTEETLAKCQDAEMPFLKGLEVLPKDESDKAIKESETASTQADAALNMCRNFLRQKMLEAKRYSNKELSKSATEELGKLQTTVDGVAKKIETFKKETMERKTNAMLADVVDIVSKAEKELRESAKISEVLSAEDAPIEKLKEACEKWRGKEKEATKVCAEAGRVVAQKQKVAKAGDAAAGLQKLNERLTTANTDLKKQRNAALAAEKLVKCKEVLATEGEKITECEAGVEKVEKLSKPSEGEKLSDETIQEIDELVVKVDKQMKMSMRSVEANLPNALGDVKAELTKLVERAKKGQSSLDAVRAATKDQRERVLSEAYVREATKMLDDVEEKGDKVNQVELPFLKGIEMLPLQEARETIQESEAAAAAVQDAVNKARTYIASKNLEIKKFAPEISKDRLEEMGKLTMRMNSATHKLNQFRKDTEGRKKNMQMQELGEKLDEIEAEVKVVASTVETLPKEETEELSEEAQAICAKLDELEKAAKSKIDSSSRILLTKQREVQAGKAEQSETLAKYKKRLEEATAELGKSKKASSDHQSKFTAKKLVAEVKERLAAMEEKVTKATEACAPLTEKGGEEFLVQSSAEVLAVALRKHMKDKSLSEADIFKKISGKKAKVEEAAFVAALEKLPEELESEEIVFSEDRRKALFKLLDAESKGAIDADQFKVVFKKTYVCVSGISMTDGFKVAESKTIGKVDPHEMVEALGNPQADEAGMERLECRLVASDKSGFVTMKGNQGTTYLQPYSPFTAFTVELAKTIKESVEAATSVSVFLKQKIDEHSKATGPLGEARVEISKLRPQVAAFHTKLEKLKTSVDKEKKEYHKKEHAEANAHIERREKKEADAITSPAAEKVEAMEASKKELSEGATPLTSVEKEELGNFATPAAVQAATTKKFEDVLAIIKEARAIIKEQQGKIGKVVTPPMQRARKELTRLNGECDKATYASKKVVDDVKAACALIVKEKSEQCSVALREHVAKKSISHEDFFKTLAEKEGDRVSEKTFTKTLEGLDGVKVTAEQAALICRSLEGDAGLSKRTFLSFLQRYYVVVKTIAITTVFDVASAKTIKKADADEIIELLEGPTKDEKIGLIRIKGKSLASGTEGWISVKGNQGTPFLQEIAKPFYVCKKESNLDSDIKEGATIRTLKPEEVFELVEGPRKEISPNATRVRVKAISDGATGWVTVTDKKGATIAEKSDKYYVCNQSVAMTDELDIKNCKVVRKMAADELILALADAVDEESSGLTRLKARSLKDDKEGWITIKGNAGTVFAVQSNKHYTVLAETTMTKTFPLGSETVRTVQANEAVHVLEGPKEEVSVPEVWVRGRALSDGAVGWVTLKADKNIAPWNANYRCKVATPLQSTLAVEGATDVRELAVGESIDIIEGPKEDTAAKVMRMRGRAKKDGAIGWVTIRDAEGKQLLLC